MVKTFLNLWRLESLQCHSNSFLCAHKLKHKEAGIPVRKREERLEWRKLAKCKDPGGGLCIGWTTAHLYAKWEEIWVCVCKMGVGDGMQRSASLPYACWSHCRQPLFCKSPLFVEEWACPIQVRREQLFSRGAPIWIVPMQKKPQPHFSYWNNSA